MADVQKPDFWNREITRRDLLKKAGRVVIAGIAIKLFGGCTTDIEPTTRLQDRIVPSPTRTPEIVRLPDITEADIKRIAERCVGDFNRVLGLSLPAEEAISKINLITDIKTYQDIVAEEETNYQSTDEKDRPGITTSSKNSRGKQIFLYKPAIDQLVEYLPVNLQGIKAREDTIEWVIDHELSHFAAAEYPSAELHSLVYERIFVNTPDFRGKKITPDVIQGAEVKAYADGVGKSAFQNLEEAEAFMIGDFVMRQRGRPQAISFFTASDLGIQPQADLLLDFLKRLGPNLDDTIKMLAAMRTEVGGREKYGRFIGEKFGIVLNDQLFFSMSLLYAIDIADKSLYQRLVNRPTRQTP